MREYNVHEVLAILKKYYVTDAVDAQVVTRWIRDGKLQGVRGNNRKEGYRVSESDLFEFIEEQRPGLTAIMKTYEEYIDGLNPEEDNKDNQNGNVNDKSNSEPDKSEINVEQLQQQINYMETQVKKLENENQKISQTIIDGQQQSKLLIEEKNQLVHLNVLLKKEIDQLKSSQQETKEKSNSKESTLTPTSQKDFLEMGKQIINDMEVNVINEDDKINHLIQIYDIIFNEDGSMRKECLQNDQFKCPLSGKTYKQQKRFIRTVINSYFKEDIENEVINKAMMDT